MSFLEFDPAQFDPPVDAIPLDAETEATRLSWRLLAQFGAVEVQPVPIEAELASAEIPYGVLNTPAINPLIKGRCVVIDQTPTIDGDIVAEPGIVALKVIHPTTEKILRQAIFYLETHASGPSVYYGESVRPESRVQGVELDILLVKLWQLERAYWHVASDLGADAILHHMPRNMAFDELDGMLGQTE